MPAWPRPRDLRAADTLRPSCLSEERGSLTGSLAERACGLAGPGRPRAPLCPLRAGC